MIHWEREDALKNSHSILYSFFIMTKEVLFTLLNKANTRDEILSIIDAFADETVEIETETDEDVTF